jgi:SAM-dependent methyltransferase
MDLARLEEIVWRTAPEARPSQVARAVEALRPSYLGGSPEPASALTAKLLFYGVADAAKLGVLLGELAAGQALPTGDTWEVLDLGAGPGVTSLALAEWLRGHGLRPRLRLTAVDRDEAALAAGRGLFAAYRDLAADGPPVEVRSIRCDLAHTPPPAGRFDLILCANLLCELWREEGDAVGARSRFLSRLIAESLAGGGALCVIEPALREVARGLHAVRDRLLEGGGLTVYAPCLRTGPCPMLRSDRDWCHEDRPIELPERTRLVARLAGVRRHSLKFSYLTLRGDEKTLGRAFPEARFRVVSERLVSKGREEVFLCGEPGRLRVLRNRRDRSAVNEPFGELDRGQVVAVEAPESRVGKETRVATWDPAAHD